MWNLTKYTMEYVYGNLDTTRKKVAIFDLDGTVTVYEPSYPTTFEFINKNVKGKIKNLYDQGYFIAFASNQEVLSRDSEKLKTFKIKIPALLQTLNVPSLFICSPFYGRCRKPCVGMIVRVMEYLDASKDKIKDFYLNEKLSTSAKVELQDKSAKARQEIKTLHDFKRIIQELFEDIFFIGDSVGRRTDYSDADLDAAHNAGIKFYLPEHFFASKQISLEDQTQKYFIPNPFQLFDEKTKATKIFEPGFFDQFEHILLYGDNYTGKSTFIKNYIKDETKVHINLMIIDLTNQIKEKNVVVLHFEPPKNQNIFCRKLWRFLENQQKEPTNFNKAILKQFNKQNVIQVPWKTETKHLNEFGKMVFDQLTRF